MREEYIIVMPASPTCVPSIFSQVDLLMLAQLWHHSLYASNTIIVLLRKATKWILQIHNF